MSADFVDNKTFQMQYVCPEGKFGIQFGLAEI